MAGEGRTVPCHQFMDQNEKTHVCRESRFQRNQDLINCPKFWSAKATWNLTSAENWRQQKTEML